MPRLPGVAVFILRILFGGFFIVSGVLKAQDPGEFLLNVRSFQMTPDPWSAWLAMGLPWLEIFAGAALVFGHAVRGALLVFVASLLVFIAALAQAWIRGIDVTCGCFGKSENRTNYPLQIGFDLVLLAVGIFLAWVRKRVRPGPPPIVAASEVRVL
ncbi:MAG: DoxX family protein [Verrucomicrobiales bacterium]